MCRGAVMGMALMPTQMGMAQMGMTQMMASPYGATAMDGMSMMPAQMAAQFQLPQAAPQVQQYVPTSYAGQQQGMMDPQQQPQQSAAGWAEQQQGSPAQGFTTLAEQQQISEYGHRAEQPMGGSFGAMQLPAHCACGGGSFAVPSGGTSPCSPNTVPPQPPAPPRSLLRMAASCTTALGRDHRATNVVDHALFRGLFAAWVLVGPVCHPAIRPTHAHRSPSLRGPDADL
jgi:hypothetical protein